MPTHSEVTRFISSLLPPRADDVSLLYHLPRHGSYNFETAQVEQIVLSVTPSPNVYQYIGNPDHGAKAGRSNNRSPSEEPQPPHTIAFLHRPFLLDRRLVRKDLLVLASHTSFGENLTIGWNPALAQRLGMVLDNSLCVEEDDEGDEQKMGIIGEVSAYLGQLLQGIEKEFGAIEHAQEGLSEEIKVVAMMNEFSADEVHRVLDLAQTQEWAPSVENFGRHVLYLTGEPNNSGLAAAKERGMTVVCVGNRSAEQWGISYLATSIRNAYPMLQVKEIYEDEYPN
jgi:putative NIF3 family GTP cyclohydrolase 1 type 2